MKPTWKKYLLYGSVIVGGILLFLLEETIRLKNTGFERKTLWDWMELLVIPFVFALAAYLLNRSEGNNERAIATDRQQEAALQAYLDRMTDLLLNEKLLTSKNRGVRNVARIGTLTVLQGLDVRRQRLVIEFLYEAQLISNQNPVVEHRGADLSGIDLSNTYLGKVNWSNVNLSKAKFNPAYLPDADLSNSNLSDANLRSAHLDKANLVGANFKRVKTLEGATMPDGTIHD